MKKLIIIFSLLVLAISVYSQRVTDTNKLIVRDSAIFNNETLKINAATNGQYLKRVNGRWVNSTLITDTTLNGTGSLTDPLRADTAYLMTIFHGNTIADTNRLDIWIQDEEKIINVPLINFTTDTTIDLYNPSPYEVNFKIDSSVMSTKANVAFQISSKQSIANMLNYTSTSATKYPTWYAAKAYVDSVKVTNPNSYKLLQGYVTDRNINVNLSGFTPTNYSILNFVTESDISTGDTLTLSVNSGTEYKIFNKTSCEDTLSMEVMFFNNVWYVIENGGSERVTVGINTGDQDLTISDDTIRLSRSDSIIDLKPYVNCSQIVQTLSGSTDTLNVANGVNGVLDISGNTTIRIEPSENCNTGNITVICEAAADSITFTGGTMKISPYLGLANGKIPVTNGANAIDVYSWWYDGTRIIINGTKGYE